MTGYVTLSVSVKYGAVGALGWAEGVFCLLCNS